MVSSSHMFCRLVNILQYKFGNGFVQYRWDSFLIRLLFRRRCRRPKRRRFVWDCCWGGWWWIDSRARSQEGVWAPVRPCRNVRLRGFRCWRWGRRCSDRLGLRPRWFPFGSFTDDTPGRFCCGNSLWRGRLRRSLDCWWSWKFPLGLEFTILTELGSDSHQFKLQRSHIEVVDVDREVSRADIEFLVPFL